jgi:copper(I)-binding protein
MRRPLLNKSLLRNYLLAAIALTSIIACESQRDATLTWSRAYVVVPAGNAPAVMYFSIYNGTDAPDTLLSVSLPSLSDHVEMHQEMKHSTNGDGPAIEMVHMMPVKSVAIPAKSDVAFSPGGQHVMIHNLKQPIAAGDSIPVTFQFAKAGTLQGNAAVITYSDVDTATAHTR